MSDPFRLKPQSTDRNDQARMAVARGQFAAQVDAGNVGAYDRLRRKLASGDYVFYRAENDVIWEIQSIEPVMDDSAPPGSVRVTIGALAQFNVLANNANPRLVKIGEKPKQEPEVQEPALEPPAGGPVDPAEHDPRD